MKKLRYLSLAVILAGTTSVAVAQDYTDALRYSDLSPYGTARSMGFGNALGSVGGDFSSLSINPAGIGIYRTSEMVFTPSLKINSTDGTYLNNSVSDNNTRFNFNNIGFVFTNAKRGKRYEKSKWKSVSFGIGVNRLADFNRDYNYSGNNSGPNSSSASEIYAYGANSGDDVNTPGSLGYIGYQSYLTNYDSTQNPPYYTVVPWEQGIKQERNVRERGGINEIVLSLGGNYMEKLMLGATLGIPILHYNRQSDYTESALNSNDFISYTNSENLTTSGAGINLKLGLIYKPSNYFRIGAAIHTPTYYSMHDEDNFTITTNFTSIGQTSLPVSSVFDYSMTTPWRGVLSATGFLGQYGFISADYEYVNYPSTRFGYSADYSTNEQQVNQQIKDMLKGASNFRIGAEGRITDFFMVRLGFGYYGSPYKNDNGVNCNSTSFSGGFGFRFDQWFVDAALVHTNYNSIEQPYITPYTNVTVPTATIKNSMNNAAITLGVKF